MKKKSAGWFPNQHGAWAMVLLPPVVGAQISGWGINHLWLISAWVIGYFGYFAITQLLRSNFKPRYRAAAVCYPLLALLLVTPLVVSYPQILIWLTVLVPLATLSFYFSWKRKDRSYGNDIVLVIVASLMAVISSQVSPVLIAEENWWTQLSVRISAGITAFVFFCYFLGTVFYVKTMIRERGNPKAFQISIIFHVLVVALWFYISPWLSLLALLLLLRAILIPKLWPRMRPATVGIIEIGLALLVSAVLIFLIR